MDNNGSAQEQITLRLQNSMTQLLLELNAQGIALATVSGEWLVKFEDGALYVTPVSSASDEAAPPRRK